MLKLSILAVVLVVLFQSFGEIGSTAHDEVRVIRSIVPTPFSCMADQWMCSDGQQCIENTSRCNGVLDCVDESDEMNCTKESNITEPVPEPEEVPAVSTCGIDQWTCSDGHCIPETKRCDGFPHCPDESDERHCSAVPCVEGQIACMSGECVEITHLCDGIAHCPDGSDETDCENVTTTNNSNTTTSPLPDVTTNGTIDTRTTTIDYNTTDIPENTTHSATTENTFVPITEATNATEAIQTSTEAYNETTQTNNTTQPSLNTTTDITNTSYQSTSPALTTSTEYRTSGTSSTSTPLTTQSVHTTDQGRTTTGVDTAPTTFPTTMQTTTGDGNFCMAMPDYGNFCRRRYRGYYRHPSTCSNFIMCEWGLLYLCRCPSLTVWDPRIENCVWAFFSPC